AGEQVTGVMHSDPLPLGTQAADAEGAVSFSWKIPSGAPLGTHAVTLTGAQSGAVTVEFEVTAAVTDDEKTADDGNLAFTGGGIAPALTAGVLLLVIGAGLAFAMRRRRA
ncbi:MAG: hypothetical protein ACTH8F_14105, partial [Microbacterium sp.]